MSASYSVVGAGTVSIALTGADVTTVENALQALSNSHSGVGGSVVTPTSSSTSGWNIYNIPGTSTFVDPGNADAVIASDGKGGKPGASITVGSETKLVSGSAGNDTINATGGTATIIGGAGSDSITVSTGNYYISTALGTDTVQVNGGVANIAGTNAKDVIDLVGGVSTVSLSYS